MNCLFIESKYFAQLIVGNNAGAIRCLLRNLTFFDISRQTQDCNIHLSMSFYVVITYLCVCLHSLFFTLLCCLFLLFTSCLFSVFLACNMIFHVLHRIQRHHALLLLSFHHVLLCLILLLRRCRLIVEPIRNHCYYCVCLLILLRRCRLIVESIRNCCYYCLCLIIPLRRCHLVV